MMDSIATPPGPHSSELGMQNAKERSRMEIFGMKYLRKSSINDRDNRGRRIDRRRG